MWGKAGQVRHSHVKRAAAARTPQSVCHIAPLWLLHSQNWAKHGAHRTNSVRSNPHQQSAHDPSYLRVATHLCLAICAPSSSGRQFSIVELSDGNQRSAPIKCASTYATFPVPKGLLVDAGCPVVVLAWTQWVARESNSRMRSPAKEHEWRSEH